MAQYGYSTPYAPGRSESPLPSGYMEAATAPGRNLAMGIVEAGRNIGAAIERYRAKKAENEAADQSWGTLMGLTQQTLSSDPKYIALQRYMDTGELPQGINQNQIDSYTQQVMADREMLNKMAALGEKFPDMSAAKKKAALGDVVMVLNQYQQRQQQGIQQQIQNQQLQLGALQLGQAQREAASAPYFTQALGEVMSRQPGQGPTTPYANVTSELLSKYGDKLTPAQMQSLIPLIRKSEQVLPPGLVPTEAKMTPAGLETTYGMTPTVGSQPIPGTRFVQPTVAGKPFGAPVKAERTGEAAKAYDDLPESLQKFADKFAADFQNEPTIKNMNIAGSFLNQMETIANDVGTARYRPSDDMALVFSFMKTLDPGSTVREGEYASAKNTTGVPGYVINAYNQALDGKFLNDEQRKSFVETARKNFSGISRQAEDVAKNFKQMARDRNVPENLVVPEGMFQRGKQTAAAQMTRIPSVEQAEATLKPGESAMVFNPATGKYQEYRKQ